jgi:hypothetical protein
VTCRDGSYASWRRARSIAVRKPPTAVGFTLAFDLYDELLEIGGDSFVLESSCRDGDPQNNVFLRFLDRLRQSGDRDAEVAFSKIITDMIGSALEGCIPDPEFQAKNVGFLAEYNARYTADEVPHG